MVTALLIPIAVIGGGRWLALLHLGRLLRRRVPVAEHNEGLVSVCIPARDEAAVIGRVVASLQAQAGADIEIIVVDDHSTDDTFEIVSSIAAHDARVRVVRAPPLPEGWLGKNHALHVASGLARGDRLLFVDADTVHHPAAVASACQFMGSADVAVVLSGQELGGWAERVISPFFWSFVLPVVNVEQAEDPAKPDQAMGNGQFAMFRTDAYRRAGGHSAVRDVVVEDVSLVRHLKRCGARYRLGVGPHLTRTRMYRSFAEVWRGFSKNVAVVRPGHRVGDTVFTLGVIAVIAIAELGPWMAFALGGWGWVVGGLHLTALVWLRSVLLRKLGAAPSEVWPGTPIERPMFWALCQPLGGVLGVLIMLRALWLQLRRRGSWKGRTLTSSRPI